MLEKLIYLTLAAIAAERATELVHSSKIFAPLRDKIALLAYPPDAAPVSLQPYGYNWLMRKITMFLNAMLACGYCLSVWVAAFFALFLSSNLSNWVFNLLLIHGGSNAYHVLYERARKGRVRTYDLTITIGDERLEEGDHV